jgi:hypothetical protein
MNGQICDACILKALEIYFAEMQNSNAQIENEDNFIQTFNKLYPHVSSSFIKSKLNLSEYLLSHATESEKHEVLKALIPEEEKNTYLSRLITVEDKERFEVKSRVVSLIKSGHTDEAIEHLLSYISTSKKSSKIRDEIIVCQSKLKSVISSMNTGTISYEESLRIQAQITISILRLTEDL